MITSQYEWEERQLEEQVANSVEAMTNPSVEDVAELAEIHRKT